jgi:hypothetical protein
MLPHLVEKGVPNAILRFHVFPDVSSDSFETREATIGLVNGRLAFGILRIAIIAKYVPRRTIAMLLIEPSAVERTTCRCFAYILKY